MGIEDYQIVLTVSLIRKESMGIECNQILLLFSIIKNESMGIEYDQTLSMFSIIKNESMGVLKVISYCCSLYHKLYQLRMGGPCFCSFL